LLQGKRNQLLEVLGVRGKDFIDFLLLTEWNVRKFDFLYIFEIFFIKRKLEISIDSEFLGQIVDLAL
jgi:hypothetical protein